MKEVVFDLNKQAPSNSEGLILTEEDFQREFEKQVKDKNIHNEKEKRNLRKRLKKKMKKHKKRARERKISFADSQ